MTTLKLKAKYYFEITDKEWEDYIEPILKEQAKQKDKEINQLKEIIRKLDGDIAYELFDKQNG